MWEIYNFLFQTQETHTLMDISINEIHIYMQKIF